MEDLGGGLKAFFEIQHRFSADTGNTNNAAAFWDGKSFVGLQTAFGSIYLGREDNPAYALSQAAGDPFGTDTVAQNTAILSGRIGANRYANSVNYRGTFGGFTLGGQYAEQDNTKPQSTGADRPGPSLPSTPVARSPSASATKTRLTPTHSGPPSTVRGTSSSSS